MTLVKTKSKLKRKRFGWFSEEAVEMGVPTSIYSTPGGSEVEITVIGYSCTRKLSSYKFKDAVCVGEVITWLRTGRKGDSVFHPSLKGE